MKEKLIDFLNKDTTMVDGWSVETNSTHYGSLYTISIDVRESKEIQCETCQGVGSIDERLGGYCFSNPEAECPDCNGKGNIEINQKENVMNEIKLEVGKKYINRIGTIVKIIKYSKDDEYPYEDEGMRTYTDDGYEWGEQSFDDNDLVEEFVETPLEINYNKSEILKAIADDKAIQFRVDEGEPWGDVKDTNWVLRMIGANTQFHLRVKPEVEKFYSILDIDYLRDGQLYVCEDRQTHSQFYKQIEIIMEDGELVSINIIKE